MIILKTFKWAFISIVAISLFILFLTVTTAGQIRQARFNMSGLLSIISQYYKANGRYPSALSDLPKFYAVSAIDKLYFDSSYFADGEFDGYRYHWKASGQARFVLSASPQRLWPMAVEFGLTEAGHLKKNTRNVDRLPDSYEEVNRWQAAGF